MSGHGLIGPSRPQPATVTAAPAPDVPVGPPADGDLVYWPDGKIGAIRAAAAPWLDQGDVWVWRDHNATAITDPAWVIPATDLAPCDGGFTYTGSLGR